MTKGIAIVSGGMDSITMAHLVRSDVDELTIVSVDYGQRHRRELEFAQSQAESLGADWHRIDMTSITDLLTSSALTNLDIEIPEGHYAEETMRSTVVPNRNAMMLDVATAIAVAQGAKWVATAVHAGDHAVYPDCRPVFIEAYQRMVLAANEGFIDPEFAIRAPFLHLTKADIARQGNRLGVDWTQTWSCYKGGSIHCGGCSTCFERREAFQIANLTDPTEYLSRPSYQAPS